MTFTEVKTDKKRYLGLLMLADEQESMIDLYLERGTMFVLSDGDDGEVRALCVVTDKGNSVLEIKNIAVVPEFQHSGYGREMIRFIENKYKGAYDILRVGTGDSPLTVPFYEKCGFAEAYRIKNFFTDNYDHPMFECGRQLVDMVCFEKKL